MKPDTTVPSRPSVWKYARLSSLVTAASLIAGCVSGPASFAAPADTTLSNTASADLSGSTSIVWEQLAPGLERRLLRPGAQYPLVSFTALRIDPALFTFRVHYAPGAPLTAAGWRDSLIGAAAVVNANFFTPEGETLGLLVSDGAIFGQSFAGFGGMFQVAGGVPRVRSLIVEPYMGEPLEQAAQAFPMLMIDGAVNYERTDGDHASRRTVVAQDASGRIVLLASSSLFGMRLADLSTFLASSDLALTNALNLDGGGSTLMLIDAPAPTFIPSFDPVPAVIALYPRES